MENGNSGQREIGRPGDIARIARGGRRADLLLLRLDSHCFTPLNDPLRQLVLCSPRSALAGSIIGGDVVMQGGEITGVNEREILQESREIAASLSTEGPKLRRWPTSWSNRYGRDGLKRSATRWACRPGRSHSRPARSPGGVDSEGGDPVQRCDHPHRNDHQAEERNRPAEPGALARTSGLRRYHLTGTRRRLRHRLTRERSRLAGGDDGLRPRPAQLARGDQRRLPEVARRRIALARIRLAIARCTTVVERAVAGPGTAARGGRGGRRGAPALAGPPSRRTAARR